MKKWNSSQNMLILEWIKTIWDTHLIDGTTLCVGAAPDQWIYPQDFPHDAEMNSQDSFSCPWSKLVLLLQLGHYFHFSLCRENMTHSLLTQTRTCDESAANVRILDNLKGKNLRGGLFTPFTTTVGDKKPESATHKLSLCVILSHVARNIEIDLQQRTTGRAPFGNRICLSWKCGAKIVCGTKEQRRELC